MKRHRDLLTVAADAAARAAAFIRASPAPSPQAWDVKGTNDYVTHIDRGAEELVAGVLDEAYPGCVILGEELSPDATSAGLLWVVDPLDGTENYLHGYPAFAVSIAAFEDGEPVAGVVHDVPRHRSYQATSGGGARCDGEPLAVSVLGTPQHALIGTGWPFKRPELLERYVEEFAVVMRTTAGIRRAGSAALDFVDVALGRFDGFWEPHLAPWDVAAGALIVREAGGRVSDYDGEQGLLRHGAFVAGNPAIHRWLLATLERVAAERPS